MDNHHEYTIFAEPSEYYDHNGWTPARLAKAVSQSVLPPFEVVMTAYDTKGKVFQQTTIPVAGVENVLKTWLDADDLLKIARIAYKISPHYLNRWVDVRDCSRKPVPNGVHFLMALSHNTSQSLKTVTDLYGPYHWCDTCDSLDNWVTAIFVPQNLSDFQPENYRPVFVEKADPKSSSQTVSANREAKVQSDICPECGNHDGEHSSGCPVVASKEAVDAFAAGPDHWAEFKDNRRVLQAVSDDCFACGKPVGEHSDGCPLAILNDLRNNDLGHVAADSSRHPKAGCKDHVYQFTAPMNFGGMPMGPVVTDHRVGETRQDQLDTMQSLLNPAPATDSASKPKAEVKRIKRPGFRATGTEQRQLKPGAEILIDQRTKLKREKIKIDGEIRIKEARRAAIDAELLALKIELNSNY